MSDIRATFETGTWKDFSKEHKTLRLLVEDALCQYEQRRCPDPLAVWGAYGAGKTQFLFWVAERAMERGFVPVYFHLNDLLDGISDGTSPDELRRHATAFVSQIVEALRQRDPVPKILDVYRDRGLLAFVQEGIAGKSGAPILLVDEVEQAYLSLTRRIRADDRSPLRAWLEEETFKVFAFAVGSLYVLGRADRERLSVQPIPPVHPAAARDLCSDMAPGVVNGIWWMSRGKPRHFMKAVKKYRMMAPTTSSEVYSFVSALDSVSQAPYEGDSQSVVPAAYLDLLDPDEVGLLVQVSPRHSGAGKLIPLTPATQDAFLSILKDTFKLEAVAFDLVRYVMMLADAVSADGYFALTEQDTPFLLRMAVDFLLEYERERLEQDTVEGNAALRKLLEVHDRANERAGEVFWKLHGKVGDNRSGSPALSFEALASAFPLPTTSPTLFGTDPVAVRTKYEEQKQPVFEWTDQSSNQVLFLTSVSALYSYSSSKQFRQLALAPGGGVLVLLPYDSEDWHLTGFLDWLNSHSRLHVVRLPLALTDFLLSLRASSSEGGDPIAVAAQAEANRNLKRQVSFYRGRLESFTTEMSVRPYPVVPSPLPTTLRDLESRVADKSNLTMALCQAFESMSPLVLGYLADLRSMVIATRTVWDRKVAPGFVALADTALPHKSPRTGRPEPAKLIEDVRTAFATARDALAGLASHVDADDMDALTRERAGEVCLRALWQVKRGIGEEQIAELGPACRQLTDIAQVLNALHTIEARLHDAGITPSLGDLATLIEARSSIGTVAKHAEELTKGRTSADKQLARAVYSRFVQGFLSNVESEVSKSKTTASKLRDSLDSLSASQQRIHASADGEAARFTEIDANAIDDLAASIIEDHKASITTASSLADILSHLEDAGESLSDMESRLAELVEAHEGIVAAAQDMEHPDET